MTLLSLFASMLIIYHSIDDIEISIQFQNEVYCVIEINTLNNIS